MGGFYNVEQTHCRTKPIITMLEEIRIIEMNRIRVKRLYALKWSIELDLKIIKVLEQNKEE